MTPLLQEINQTHLVNAPATTVPGWAEKYKYPNIGSTVTGEIISGNTVNSIAPGVLLPGWAEIAGDEVNYFLQSYSLGKELETCINIIGTIIKPRPKAKVRLVDDSECYREYISISLVSNRNNMSKMADYIYSCNIAIARSLSSNKLQYFIITME